MSAETERAGDKALEEALAERNRLWAQVNEQRADQLELEYLRNELEKVHNSTTWRILGRYQRVKELARTGIERLRKS